MERKILGIGALMALTTAIAAAANTVGAVAHDNTVDFKDLQHVPSALKSVSAFSEVEFDQIQPELDDLSGEEQDQLAEHFKTQFNLENEEREKVLEQGFGYLLQGIEAFKALKNLSAKIAK